MKRNTNTILEIFTKSNVFSTSSINFKDLSTTFSWGYAVNDFKNGDLAYPIAIYKDADPSTNPKHRTYNTMQFTFKVAEDTADDVNLSIKLVLAPGKALLSSLTHTLPNFPGTKVYCFLDTVT